LLISSIVQLLRMPLTIILI